MDTEPGGQQTGDSELLREGGDDVGSPNFQPAAQQNDRGVPPDTHVSHILVNAILSSTERFADPRR